MAEKSGKKESTPPPLLLCPPSGGLTLTPAQGSSLFMPVPQTEASLMASDEFDRIAAEADSFVGQTPPQEPGPLNYFTPTSSQTADAFDSVVGQSMPPTSVPFSAPAPPTTSSAVPFDTPLSQPAAPPPPQSFAAIPTMTPPPRGTPSGGNLHRMQGTPRYAPPPAGTYSPAPSTSIGLPPGSQTATPSQPPLPGSFPPPPMTGFTPGPSPSVSRSKGVGHTTEVTLGSPQGLPAQGFYEPPAFHWFYSSHMDLRQIWKPFSVLDSAKLEEAFSSGAEDNLVVSVQGGRFDVDIIERSRTPVYWEEAISHVRRCSWFYKEDGESRFLPYEEDFANKLEDEYRNAVVNDVWHKRLEFDGNETVVMHNPGVIVHYSGSSQPDEWGTSQGDQARPRVVKRGTDEFENLQEGEAPKVDHLVFVVHGIGPTCDLRFRNIVECVDDMRDISLQMLKSHFQQYQDEGRIGRVEFLPVRWHDALHGDATGVDRKLKAITLPSIGKLRHFTNDVLLDILFYGSPAYCQKIADVVSDEMNRLYRLFLSRNPSFKGAVSVAGHSLGSLILFDLLAHQGDQPAPQVVDQHKTEQEQPVPAQEQNGSSQIIQEESESQEDNIETLEQLLEHLALTDYLEAFKKEKIDIDTLSMCEESDIKEMGIPMGPRKKLQSFIKLHKSRQERKREAEEKRRREEMERSARLEEEKRRAESAQQAAQSAATNDPLLREASCDSINFVKGLSGTGVPLVSYPKLDFAPSNFFAMGSPVAMFLTTRGVEFLGEEFAFPTCSGFFNIFHPFDPVAYRLEPLLTQMVPPKPFLMPHHKGRKRLHLELKESLTRMGADIKARVIESVKRTWKTINDFALAHRTNPQEVMEQEVNSVISEMTREEEDRLETGSITSSVQEEDVLMGHLNQGRRVDYVLQERPIESFNDYLFALGSHYSYWESEDTILMILKETYALLGLAPIKPGEGAHKQRLPPPPMASPPGSLLASPVAPPPSHMAGPGIAPPPVSGFSAAGPSGLPPPPMMGSYGTPPPPVATTGAWSAGAPPPASSTPLGPPPISGFVRKQ